MPPLLYGPLVPWYRLLDPPADHADEAASYQAALERAVSPPAETLLELGAGGGHNALHLKRRFRCTLADLSPPMLALSRDLNPDCAHVEGDMRTLRLDRTFDAILVHDAVMYMATEEDLLAAIRTSFAHTRPGGAAVFAPDCVRETFRENTDLISGADGRRALRGIEWMWDPNPDDNTYLVEYALLLRDGDEVKAAHDRHLEGLFPRETWRRLLTGVGYHVETFPRPLGEGEFDACFVCRRP